jgi:hypothetical protein
LQYVLMAIPTALVPQVANLIAGFEVRSESPVIDSPAVCASPSPSDGSLINGWTQDLVRRAFKESADPMRKLLLFLADHADEEVTSIDIAEAIEAKRGWNTVAGMLGALGRRSVNRYDREQAMWESRWGADGRGRLKMPAAVAAVIKTVAAE